MNICCICDYTEQHGSPLLNTPPKKGNVVRYSNKHDGYYCTECLTSISEVMSEFEKEDENSRPVS